MTFDEAVAAPGRIVQLWSEVLKDGDRVVSLYRLAEDAAAGCLASTTISQQRQLHLPIRSSVE